MGGRAQEGEWFQGECHQQGRACLSSHCHPRASHPTGSDLLSRALSILRTAEGCYPNDKFFLNKHSTDTKNMKGRWTVPLPFHPPGISGREAHIMNFCFPTELQILVVVLNLNSITTESAEDLQLMSFHLRPGEKA